MIDTELMYLRGFLLEIRRVTTCRRCGAPGFSARLLPQVQRLAALREIQRNASGEVDQPCEMFPPLDRPRHFDANAGMDLLRPSELLGMSPAKRESEAYDPSNPDRAWLYQTCTEFGFYQASDYEP